jgi:ABC-type uncharacterized transport system permease subunit
MTVATVAAWIVVAVLAALAVLQVLVALGRPLGRFVWGGRHEVLPTRLRIGSLVSVLVYAAIAVLVLDRAGVLDVLPDGVAVVGTWVVTAYFALGILANAASRSPSERAVMTPVSLVLAVCSLLVALS